VFDRRAAIRVSSVLALVLLLLPISARAQHTLCDPAETNCRDILLQYIRNEKVAIDVAFWFMEDARYTNELIRKAQVEKVPVRVIVDSRANETYSLNIQRLEELEDAGIPMRERFTDGILHWKMMLFHGQGVVEFSGANYSADAWRPGGDPYVNYIDEAIFFTSKASIVDSFRTKYDDLWTDTTDYRNYANITGPLTRSYDTYQKDPELNFPPLESYGSRTTGRYKLEEQKIDVIMYRVTDRRHTDAMLAAEARGVPVRLITEPEQYRDPTRLWHSWNIDRMHMGGVEVRNRAHAGLNHQKSVLLYGLGLTIFGSSNWTSSSSSSQEEHNLFTTDTDIFQWFVNQFERKWNNSTGVSETAPFVPLPPDKPKNPSPAIAAIDVDSSVTLRWYGGPFAHVYDVYFGTSPNPPKIAENLELGPSESDNERQQFTIPATLSPGTTYYWRVVSKTMAQKEAAGDVWSFTTAGSAEPPPPPPPNGTLGPGDILLYASDATARATWTNAADGTAAGATAIWHPNAGQSKRSSAAASPTQYFDIPFTAQAGVAYRLWIRGRAQNNDWANDSVFVQFSGSVKASGSAIWRIGSTSATEMNLEDCSGCGLSGWGWQDNGWGVNVLGPLVHFQTSGPQTIRIQTREDGLYIDQILLSPSKFLSTAPGPLKNDQTIYPESQGDTEPLPPTVTVVRQPYLQQVTSTSAVIAWTTRQAGPAEVRLLQGSDPKQTVTATTQLFDTAKTGMAANYYQHVAEIQGLNAATTYQYDIIVGGADANPGTDSFKTAPSSTGSTVSFVAIGDSGTGSTAQQQIAARLQSDTFDFALHAGDLAYGNGGGTGGATYQTQDDWFFAIYKGWLRSRPMFPSIGNHDSRDTNNNGEPYLSAFVLPTNGASTIYPDHAERYYSFDYGPAHVVVLDTELAFQDTNRRAEQLAWLADDLNATNKPWKIALFHRSPYSSGGEHGSDLAVRAAFGPVFEQHGVQLAISAHEHTYERTIPIEGVTYVVTGGGGGPLYPAGTSSFTAASASRYHYLKTSVSECMLTLNAIDVNGVTFDTTTMNRCEAPGDTEPPTVSITSPANNATVSGQVSVAISANDNVGVTGAELLVDANTVAADGTAPFGFTWSSASVSNGAHTLEVRVADAAGNTASSGAIVVQVDNAAAPSGDLVLYAGDAPVVQGGWRRETNAAAAGGALLRHPNAGAGKLSTALANPTHYFEMTFEAQANVPYHLWIRGRADSNHWANDSVFVQFSGATAYGIGTTSAAEVNLEDCSGCDLAGWGWQDNGWGVNVMGPHITFNTSGVHTIRVQTREDGLSIDQIVLSPATYLTSSPGALKHDTTILPPSGSTPPPPDTEAPTAAINSPAQGATVGGTVNVSVGVTDNVGVKSVDLLVDGDVVATDSSAPFSFAWDTTQVADGTHSLRLRAHDAADNTGTSQAVQVTVDQSSDPVQDVVLYASDAANVAGAWELQPNASAAGGFAVAYPNANRTKLKKAQAAPADYVEFTFQAVANVPYHLWIRARAQNDYWGNDSVFIQFSSATAYNIGTTSAAEMNLEDCSGCDLSGWGWQDNGWGVNVMGPNIIFTTTGPQTIRIQSREDGILIDQIVLSPTTYLNTSPGALTNDNTIVGK
jgi:hypothetical protein